MAISVSVNAASSSHAGGSPVAEVRGAGPATSFALLFAAGLLFFVVATPLVLERLLLPVARVLGDLVTVQPLGRLYRDRRSAALECDPLQFERIVGSLVEVVRRMLSSL